MHKILLLVVIYTCSPLLSCYCASSQGCRSKWNSLHLLALSFRALSSKPPATSLATVLYTLRVQNIRMELQLLGIWIVHIAYVPCIRTSRVDCLLNLDHGFSPFCSSTSISERTTKAFIIVSSMMKLNMNGQVKRHQPFRMNLLMPRAFLRSQKCGNTEFAGNSGTSLSIKCIAYCFLVPLVTQYIVRNKCWGTNRWVLFLEFQPSLKIIVRTQFDWIGRFSAYQ